MKVTVISNLIHKAIGITTVSASTEAEACRIAKLDFASFLSNTDTLAVALYSSHPSIYARFLDLPDGDHRKEAAEKAHDLHLSPDRVPPLAREGFFSQQLRILLNIGNYNNDYGARLVPVFAYMLEHKAEHCLEASLVDDIQRFLAKRDFVDGYTMISQTIDTCCIMPSLWGRKGVE